MFEYIEKREYKEFKNRFMEAAYFQVTENEAKRVYRLANKNRHLTKDLATLLGNCCGIVGKRKYKEYKSQRCEISNQSEEDIRRTVCLARILKEKN